MTEELRGENFVATRRLSDIHDKTIADVGQTCERVPAGRHGGTVSDALRKLLASGKIAPKPETPKAPATRRRRAEATDESEAQ